MVGADGIMKDKIDTKDERISALEEHREELERQLCDARNRLRAQGKGDGHYGVLWEALSGERGSDQQRIAEVVAAWGSLMLRKNADYGSSAWRSPVLMPGLEPRSAILVRMSDKIERIGMLAKKEAEVRDEGLEDTIRDLGAYCLLWLAYPNEAG